MRIAQIAPLFERVPPKLYGGTERVVSYLTESLVEMGHDVTLFASGDSITNARLIAGSVEALRLDRHVRDSSPYILMQLEQVLDHKNEFDILHFHNEYFHYPFLKEIAGRVLTTMHGPIYAYDRHHFYKYFWRFPINSISFDQRKPMPELPWIGTVYHGLPPNLLPFVKNSGNYLAFLGRISPEKRPDRAIEISKQTGIPLKIAAKVDKADRTYWEEIIEPMIANNSHVEFVGEINETQKAEFLGNALALLFPIDWPEPFGLVMIEAMSCGTPVIGFRRGSVPEIIEHGITGYVCDDITEAVHLVKKVSEIDRTQVRERFLQRFSASAMAHNYVQIYEQMMKNN